MRRFFFVILGVCLVGGSGRAQAQVKQGGGGVQPLCVQGCGGGGSTLVYVFPDGGSVELSPNSGPHLLTFQVSNEGTGSGTFTFSAICKGTGLICGAVTPASWTLGGGGVIDVDVTVSVGSVGGSVTLSASGPTSDVGSYIITLTSPGAPVVALQNQNGTNLDRGLCLTTGAGEAAGVSCGDLFVTHGMPAYRTLGRDRSVSLLYNSAAATGLVLVAANVSQPAGTATPTSVRLILTVGTAKDSAQYAPVAAGQTQQMVVGRGITGLATGVYPMTLIARNIYSASALETVVTGTVLVVNRAASEFGAGWALLGLEQVLMDPADSTRRVWVAGDGSIRLYTKPTPGSNVFLGAAGDAPDSLVRFLNGGNLWYRRQLKHGVAVEFDQAGRHRTTTNRVGAITSFYWSSTSPVRLDSITVPPNDAIRRTYRLFWNSGTALLDSIKDPGGRLLKSTMTAGALAALTDPDNQVTRFNYTGGRLTKRIYPRKGMVGDTAHTSFAYANNARVTAVNIQTDNAATLFATTALTPWDEKGLAQSYGTPSYGYPSSSAGLPSRVDGPLSGAGDASDLLVNRFGQPTRITNLGLNTVTTINYDSVGLLPALVTRVVYPHASVSGAAGRSVRMAWNARGNLMEVRDSTCRKLAGCSPAQVATTSYQYGDVINAPDSPTRVTDALGRFTRYFYNGLGLTDSVLDARSHGTKFWYTPSGVLSGMLDSVAELQVETWKSTQPDTGFVPTNQTTRFLYDVNGNVRRMTSPLGVITSYVPDALGRITAAYDPLGGRTSYGFDALNRITATIRDSAKQTHPGGIDPLALPGCASDQILCTDPTQAPTAGPTLTATYYHGAVGLDSVADPRQIKRRFQYDARGHLVQEQDEFLQARTSVYDQAGLLVRTLGRINAGNTHRDTVSYLYDAVGRRTNMLLSMTPGPYPYPQDTVPADTVRTTYDLLNRVLVSSNRNGSIVRTYYDDGALRTQVTVFVSGGRDSASYEYDASGARTRVTRTWSPTGATDVFTYGYTATGDLSTLVASWAGGTPAPTTVSFTWDGLGRRHRVTYPNGITVNLRYDAGGLLRRQVVYDPPHGVTGRNDNLTVTYRADSVDAMGRTLHLFWNCGGQGAGSPCEDTQQTTWDKRNRYDRFGWLASSCCKLGLGIETYQYDRSGNRRALLQPWPGNSHYYTYTNVPVLSNILVRDSSPGQTFAQERQFASNANGARTGEFHSNLQDKLFYYDALGRTAGVRDYDHFTGFYIDCSRYNADGQLFQPCDNELPSQIFDGDNVAALNINAERWVFLPGPGLDDPLVGLYRHLGTGEAFLYFYVTDGQGRQLAVARDHGAMIDNDEFRYLSRGGKYAGGTSNAQSFSASRMETSAAPGISYFRNRAYDQTTGRWLQEDPIGIAGGLNLYQFNGNNPVAYTDPFGLAPCPPDNDCDALVATLTAAGVAIGGFFGGGAGGLGGLACGPAAAICSPALASSFSSGGAAIGGAIGAGLGIYLSKGQADAVATAQSQVNHIARHLGNLTDEPDSPAASGWRTELRAAAGKIRNQLKHMGKKTGAKWREYVEGVEKAIQDSEK